MITKKDREEAEAYCAEQDGIGASLIKQAEEHYEKRITELEGKIARARKALEDADRDMGGLARISFRKHIATAWKELK